MRNKLRKKGRYVTKASLRHITANDEASSLSGDFIIAHHSPALFKKGEEGRKKGSFTSIQMLHTHTRQSRGNPERQERTHDGPTAKNSAGGGRGTDGPPEPTYTAKRTWQNQSTHLNPTTHYGETSRRVIRDQWGLVGEKRKQQN